MLPFIGEIINGVGNIADDLLTSKEEELNIALKSKVVDALVLTSQIGVHAEEVKHPSLFVAGARLAVIWVAAAGFAYHFLAHPLLTWIWHLCQAVGYISADLPAPPALDTNDLMALATGGGVMGAYRSYDKLNGTDTKQLRKD